MARVELSPEVKLAGIIILAVGFAASMTYFDSWYHQQLSATSTPESAPAQVLPPISTKTSNRIQELTPTLLSHQPSLQSLEENPNCRVINNPHGANFLPDQPTVLWSSDAAKQLGFTKSDTGELIWWHDPKQKWENHKVKFSQDYSGLPSLVHNQIDAFCKP